MSLAKPMQEVIWRTAPHPSQECLRAESNPVQRGHPSADGIPVIAETLTFGYARQLQHPHNQPFDKLLELNRITRRF